MNSPKNKKKNIYPLGALLTLLTKILAKNYKWYWTTALARSSLSAICALSAAGFIGIVTDLLVGFKGSNGNNRNFRHVY